MKITHVTYVLQYILHYVLAVGKFNLFFFLLRVNQLTTGGKSQLFFSKCHMVTQFNILIELCKCHVFDCSTLIAIFLQGFPNCGQHGGNELMEYEHD